MKVINRINNNVVLVSSDQKRMIVTGKGLGFQVYPGDTVNERFIEQRFVLQQEDDDRYYIDLLKEMPMELLTISKRIVELAEQKLNRTLSMNLIFALADHLCFAIQRYRKGMELTHPLAWEIQQFYPKEIEVGKAAVALLQQESGLAIPDGEAIFIAMHLVNFCGGFSEQYDVAELTAIMRHIVDMIEDHFHLRMDQSTAAFTRFITHLRYYLIRQLNFEMDDSIHDELLLLVRETYPEAFACAQKITAYLNDAYHYRSSDSEELYLTLHINRLITK